MIIIEPHIHMISRTTDDYQRMYNAGIRACLEPAFWFGSERRYAGTFFDYFKHILEFETTRARRFGIDHYAAISVNPKEAENLELANEVLDGIGEYIDHERCVAVGEIGFNNINDSEAEVFSAQLKIAEEKKLPVMIHLPHFNKPEGVERTLELLKDVDIPKEMILIDHNTEDTMPMLAGKGYYLGLTVYPISKLTPERVSNIIREFGSEQILVNGSADWGVSDPLSLLKVVNFLKEDGHPEEIVKNLVFETAMSFYSHSPGWKPELDLEPVDPREFQR